MLLQARLCCWLTCSQGVGYAGVDCLAEAQWKHVQPGIDVQADAHGGQRHRRVRQQPRKEDNHLQPAYRGHRNHKIMDSSQ